VSVPTTPNHAPSAVLMDMGGVLLQWDPVRLFERLLGDCQRAEALIDEIDLHAWNDRIDLGESYHELIPQWQAAHPHRAAEIAAYRDRWAETLTEAEPGVAEVVDALRAAGVPVALLSNTSAETFGLCRAVAPVLDRLDGIVLSSREGVAKPDRALFDIALSRLGWDAAHTAFVDDRLRNVAAAAQLGLQAVTFTTAAALRRDLRALGLPV
jgi:2-haloacid dehalogenase